jgi:precorrin isomerase
MAKVKERSKKEGRERIFLKSGEEFTPELEEELAAEAERGYDLSKARRRVLKRPVLADGEIRPQDTLLFSQVEFNAVCERAEDEGRPIDDVAREMLAERMES